MKQTPLSRLVMAALFAALTCIATLVIQLRVTPTGGYVNLGDCGVLLSAWLLSTPYAVAAAAVSSALADLVAGYAYYAPATLVIKALMALLGGAVFRFCARRSPSGRAGAAGCILSAAAAEAVMACGYCAYDCFVLGLGSAALLGMIGNAVQAVCGIVSATAVYTLLRRSRALDARLDQLRK